MELKTRTMARRRYWRNFNKRRLGFESWAIRLVAQQFREEVNRVDKAMAATTEPQACSFLATQAVKDGRQSWNKLYQQIYSGVLRAFGVPVYEDLMSQVGKSASRKDSLGENYWDDVALEHMATEGARDVVMVTDTTRRQIAEQIALGLAKGEGVFQLRQRIDRLYLDEIIPHRSEVIARTEVCEASNLASYAAAMRTGLRLWAVWVSTPDERTRDWHRLMDGQRVALGEAFSVPLPSRFGSRVERMRYPLDKSLGASAANIIQCRCTVVFEVMKSPRVKP